MNISGLEDTTEEIDLSVKENVKSSKIFTQNIQETWDTMLWVLRGLFLSGVSKFKIHSIFYPIHFLYFLLRWEQSENKCQRMEPDQET